MDKRDVVQEGGQRFQRIVAQMGELRDQLFLQTLIDHLIQGKQA